MNVNCPGLIDLEKEQIFIYRSDGSEVEKDFDQILTGDDVLPGLSVRIKDLLKVFLALMARVHAKDQRKK